MGLAGDRVRVVYDCMVFLQGAARSSSPAGLCLSLAEKGFVELCLSKTILDEVGEVLRRPKVRVKFPTLDDELVSEFLRALRGFSTLFEDVTRELAFARDPKDEPLSVEMPICLTCRLHPIETLDVSARSAQICGSSIRLRFWFFSSRLQNRAGNVTKLLQKQLVQCFRAQRTERNWLDRIDPANWLAKLRRPVDH